MGVSLIAWGRFFDKHGNRVTVPAPSTMPGAPWLWDFLANEAIALRRVGFSSLQLPPAGKAQGGTGMAHSIFVILAANHSKEAYLPAMDP